MFKFTNEKFRYFHYIILILMSYSGIAISVAEAGEATEVIEEALEAYNKQDLGGATDALNEALAIVMQEKATRMETKCPKALDGWEKEKTVSNSSGAAFGAGTVTECIYRNDNKEVTISFTVDSPMVQTMMMMFNNPMFATADGGKVKRIKADGKKHKTIIKYNEQRKSGEITSLFETILVSVKGEASQDELISFFRSIKFSSLN